MDEFQKDSSNKQEIIKKKLSFCYENMRVISIWFKLGSQMMESLSCVSFSLTIPFHLVLFSLYGWSFSGLIFFVIFTVDQPLFSFSFNLLNPCNFNLFFFFSSLKGWGAIIFFHSSGLTFLIFFLFWGRARKLFSLRLRKGIGREQLLFVSLILFMPGARQTSTEEIITSSNSREPGNYKENSRDAFHCVCYLKRRKMWKADPKLEFVLQKVEKCKGRQDMKRT